MATAHEFLRALYAGCAGLAELRALPCRARMFVSPVRRDRIDSFLRSHAAHNLYMGVATRQNADSGRADNCAQLGAAFVDLDFSKTPENVVWAQLEACELQPSILNASGGGVHAYWLFNEPIQLSTSAHVAKNILRRLARALGGDPVVAEVARVLRVPETLNHKFTPPKRVEILRCDPERRYALEELDAWLPQLPAEPVRSSIEVPRQWHQPGFSSERLDRARAYLRAMGPAIQGNAGDLHTYRGACWLVHDLDLTDGDALDVLREWNAGCVPPWSDAELIDKVEHARRYGVHPRGAALMNDRVPVTQMIRVRVS